MFQPLPAETVFEARRRTKRATVRLFLLLVVLYVVFFNLMIMGAFLGFGQVKVERLFTYVPAAAWIGTGLAVLLASLHFLSARSRDLGGLLASLGTVPADPKDKVHQVFLNLVGEAEAATGLRGIKAVILPTPGCNAFSLQDGKGNRAIGATEGILTRLTRPELSAVVAHEAAHLVHEDSRLVTTACFLFQVFAKIHEAIGGLISNTRTSYSSRRKDNLPGVLVVLWIISGVAYLCTRLVSMAISREREYYADSDGVAMCKDPLALAEGLSKIADRYRGNAPGAFSALFILNPALSKMDEGEGALQDLFSTHPPVAGRVKKLLTWAKSDMKTLQERLEREEKEAGAKKDDEDLLPGAKSSFMVREGEEWKGPFGPLQLLALGGLAPGTWVCRSGTQDVQKASDSPELLPLFEQKVKDARTDGKCPRCHVSLLSETYEGAEVEHCAFCEGYLLPPEVLMRIITREGKTFDGEQKAKALKWKNAPAQTFRELDRNPEAACPHCGSRMAKQIQSTLTRVMIDRCTKPGCGCVWCDGGELETIQILMEDARRQTGQG